MKHLLFIALFATLFVGCANPEKFETADTEIEAVATEASAQLDKVPNTDLYSDGKTKLIKTAHFRFQVKNVKQSAEAIEAAVRKYPSFISASDMRLINPTLENKMTIRVQNEFFQDLLKEIDQQAVYVNFRDVKTEDVAKQFVDLESRLKTKREVEDRYTEILRKKAGTIEELMDAERMIGALHEEIEATISRINYLRDAVQYSTIDVEFYQTIDPLEAEVRTEPRTNELADALKAGWLGVVTVVIALLYLWPIWILAGGAFLTYKLRHTQPNGL